MGGTLLQTQGDEWVVIGFHSNRLPKSAKNFGITELELTVYMGLEFQIQEDKVCYTPLKDNVSHTKFRITKDSQTN